MRLLRADRRTRAQDVFCSTKPSWQGDCCAPPLHPPGRGSVRALNPCLSQQTVSPVNHSRETSLSLHPSLPSGRSGAIAPPEPTLTVWPLHPQSRARSCSPDTPMTISWRPTLRGLDAATSWRRLHRDRGREPSCYPSLEPSLRPWGASHPLEPRPRGETSALPYYIFSSTTVRQPHTALLSPHGPLLLNSTDIARES